LQRSPVWIFILPVRRYRGIEETARWKAGPGRLQSRGDEELEPRFFPLLIRPMPASSFIRIKKNHDPNPPRQFQVFTLIEYKTEEIKELR
jgi:hypothetical protein